MCGEGADAKPSTTLLARALLWPTGSPSRSEPSVPHSSHPNPSHLQVAGLTGWMDVIRAPSPFRFKYVLVNMSSGLVQDQTLWSDPIRTNRSEWWEWAGAGGSGWWWWGGSQGNLGKQTWAVTLKTLPGTGRPPGL